MRGCRLGLIVVLWLAAVFAAAAQGLPAPMPAHDGAALAEPLDALLDAAAATAAEADLTEVATDPPGGDLSALRAPEPAALQSPPAGGQWRRAAADAAEPPWQDGLWRPPSRDPLRCR